MKKAAAILLFLVITFSVTDCNKEIYPRDIPKWLKVKIDQMGKDHIKDQFGRKDPTCKYIVPRYVEEYTDGSSTYYWITNKRTYVPTCFDVYNYDGQEVCNSSCGNPPCGNYGYSKKYVRRVWTEDCK